MPLISSIFTRNPSSFRPGVDPFSYLDSTKIRTSENEQVPLNQSRTANQSKF